MKHPPSINPPTGQVHLLHLNPNPKPPERYIMTQTIKTSKTKKPNTTAEDLDALKSDVASFASSLGLFTSLPTTSTTGFDDSDFRKTGPLKSGSKKTEKNNTVTTNENPKSKPYNKTNKKPKPQPRTSPQAQFDNDNDNDLWRAKDKYKNLPKLPLVKASRLGVWHLDAAELEEKVIGGEEKSRVEIRNIEEWKGLVKKKKELGERLLAQYVKDYESSRGQYGDIRMLMATQSSGTAADKVSAYSVLLGDNPIANMRSLDALIGMVTSKIGKRHSLTGFEALKELFLSSLLPDRKLKTLLQRPLNHLPESKDGYSLLLFWYWEECIKQRYERFVVALEEASRDVLAILKDKALKTMYVLLRSKSEQERRLLSGLVNKLGDPATKAASNADYFLLKLLADHPNMKNMVVDEVDNFLFRPHLGLKAKYHAVNFLTQIRLSHQGDGPKVAKRLIDIYFALFKVLISKASEEHMAKENSKEKNKKAKQNKKGKNKKATDSSSKDNKENDFLESHVEMDSRLLSALLTGVNRAFPFVSSVEADDIIDVQTPMLFQLVHSRNFNVGVQALILLDKISSKNQIVSDRFYRALYAKLLLPAAMKSSKEEMFFGLLLRAMKSDINIKRIAAFSKRLLQVALQLPPQYACGCLFLLSEVLKANPPLWNMVLQNESVDEDLEHFEDIAEDGEDKARPIEDRTDDVGSRNDSITATTDSSSDDEVPATSESDDGDMNEPGRWFVAGPDNLEESKSLTVSQEQESGAINVRSLLPGGYNPRLREPSFCNADHAGWWELTVLASHLHPSVATMARTILSGVNIVYNGNPLHDLSLTAFLDKFMEKKPKKSTWHGASQIEPSKKLDMNHQLIGPEILSLAEADVAPEDLVFHKFYANKTTSSKKQKKKKKQAEDENGDEILGFDGVEDESDNEEIENMLDSENPTSQADSDYDYDDLDNIANDDDDLIGNVSDEEMDVPSDMVDADLDDADVDSANIDGVKVGEADDASDEEESSGRKKRKGKSHRTAGASPFASLEDYEHLMSEESPAADTTLTKKQKPKQKKRKASK